jgi:hypothetical protein
MAMARAVRRIPEPEVRQISVPEGQISVPEGQMSVPEGQMSVPEVATVIGVGT